MDENKFKAILDTQSLHSKSFKLTLGLSNYLLIRTRFENKVKFQPLSLMLHIVVLHFHLIGTKEPKPNRTQPKGTYILTILRLCFLKM